MEKDVRGRRGGEQEKMRELKFRAWDKKQKKWLGVNLQMSIVDGCLYWQFGYGCEILSREEAEQIRLVQYLGKKDKKDKEIYDGDWLKWNNDFYWVNWDDFNGCWYGEPHIDNINIGILTAPSFKDSEIVGSKLEHPEHGEKTV